MSHSLSASLSLLLSSRVNRRQLPRSVNVIASEKKLPWRKPHFKKDQGRIAVLGIDYGT